MLELAVLAVAELARGALPCARRPSLGSRAHGRLGLLRSTAVGPLSSLSPRCPAQNADFPPWPPFQVQSPTSTPRSSATSQAPRGGKGFFRVLGGEPPAKCGPLVCLVGPLANPLPLPLAGTLSMANSGPESGGSQFFINVARNSRLDWFTPGPSKHPVFGRVVEGYDTVVAITQVPTGTVAKDQPNEPIKMVKITVTE